MVGAVAWRCLSERQIKSFRSRQEKMLLAFLITLIVAKDEEGHRNNVKQVIKQNTADYRSVIENDVDFIINTEKNRKHM